MGGGHVSLAAKNKNNDERVEKCKTYTQKKLWGRALKNIASRPSRRPSGQRHAFSTTHPNREMLGTGGCWAQGIELYDFEQYDVTHTSH